MTPIVFPGLGIEVTIDRVAFTLFGWPIYWYGVIIACGFLLGLTFSMRQAPRLGLNPDDLLDMMFAAVPCAILGARAYYVIFYLDLYRDASGAIDWGEVVSIWDGGLAIYGGLIGAVLAAAVFCHLRKLPFFTVADCVSYGLLIGQLVGRWGNFVNQEAYGGPCTAPWRMGLTAGGTYIEVHPTFLYESLWNLLGLVLLYTLVRPRRRFDGQLFASYVLWYGLGRAWIEGMRTDSLYLFGTGIRVSQALAIVSAAAALAVILRTLRRRKTDPKPLYAERVRDAQDAASETGTDQPNREENKEKE